MGKLTNAIECLMGAGRNPITTRGRPWTIIYWKGESTRQTVFVIGGVQSALMGRPAIQELNVLPFLSEVNTTKKSSSVPEEHTPLLQDRLRVVTATYKVELVEDEDEGGPRCRCRLRLANRPRGYKCHSC